MGGENIYNKYIRELKNGKKIRVKYNKQNHDYCEEDGWWSEELWVYDSILDLFKCYYPISSYEKDFYTAHTQSETESFFRESIRDSDKKHGEVTVTDIIIEDCGVSNSSLSIRELAIEKMKTMSDDEIKNRMLL